MSISHIPNPESRISHPESQPHTLDVFPRILICGETGISVEFGDAIDPLINAEVRRLYATLRTAHHAGILDLIPTYRALFIAYDPWQCSFERLALLVEEALASRDAPWVGEAPLRVLPATYGGASGPDLELVSRHHQMSEDLIIQLHCQPVYTVYMIGFTPGFAYLGGLDERLVTPRKKEPRRRVPAGSIGIADRQTGVYSIDSPGGWQIIGKTSEKLFDLCRVDPFLLKPGYRVRFEPVSEDSFAPSQNP